MKGWDGCCGGRRMEVCVMGICGGSRDVKVVFGLECGAGGEGERVLGIGQMWVF